MRKKLKNRARQLPADLPLGNPSWLTGPTLHRITAGVVVSSILLPLLFLFAEILLTAPSGQLSSGLFLPLVSFLIAFVWLAFAIRRMRVNALDSKERSLSSISSLLVFAGFVGAWQGVSNLSFYVGAFTLLLGLSLSLFVIASYRQANRWLIDVWNQENPSWRISEERMPSGWEELPKAVYSTNDEMFDTLLFRYEEDPGDDAPYRQANKKVPYAKVPFESPLATRLISRAIGFQVAKTFFSLLLLIPLFYRVEANQNITPEFCTTSGFVDILETERGLFTITQDGQLLLTRENKTWRQLQSNPPANTQISGVWGIRDSLYLTAMTDGLGTIYQLNVDSGDWRPLYQTDAMLNDLYGYEIDSESTVIVAVGAKGTVVRSMDAGKTWTPLNLGIDNSLYAVWGSRTGGFYAVGSESLIISSSNAGGDWLKEESPIEDDLVSVWGSYAPGKIPGQIYAVSATGTVIFSTRASWNKFDNFFKFRPSGIFGTIDPTPAKEEKANSYAKAKDIYVVGQQGVITRHDGFGWSPMKSGTGDALWGGLVNEEGIFVIGINGALLFSDDDGESFTPMLSPFDHLMRCSAF